MAKRVARIAVWVAAWAVLLVVWVPTNFSQQTQRQSVAVELHEQSHAISPPLRQITPLIPQLLKNQPLVLLRPHPLAGARTQTPDSALQFSSGPPLATSRGPNFLGLGAGLGSFTPTVAPPDTSGAVGPSQYVQWVNSSFVVFAKYDNQSAEGKTYSAGQMIYGPAPGNTFWIALGGPCAENNSGEATAQYDKQAGRWVMMQPVLENPYTLCLAVSQTTDALGSYNLYSFSIPSNYFPDQPKMGVWPDGYYISYNAFQGSVYVGAAACVLDRVGMLLAQPATMQCFQDGPGDANLMPADLDGYSGAAGTSPGPPSGAPAYFLELGSSTSLKLWKFHVDWANAANSTLTGPLQITVPAYGPACGSSACIPQADTSQMLDPVSDRLMYRVAYRNLGGTGTLLATHAVDTGHGNTGLRWYQIQGLDAKPNAVQVGTYSPDANYRWQSSIGMDKYGNMALGYNVSGASMHPAVSYSGRLANDPPNTLESENALVEGGGSQLAGLERWGDYGTLAVDPVDDCTFWYSQAYLLNNGTYNWSTRVASFNFSSAGCGEYSYSVAASPPIQSVSQGSSTRYTVALSRTSSYNGSVKLTAVGLPSGATAHFSSPSLSGSGGSASLTVNTDPSISAGTYYFSVEGNDGSLASLTPLVLGVSPASSAGPAPGTGSGSLGQRARYALALHSASASAPSSSQDPSTTSTASANQIKNSMTQIGRAAVVTTRTSTSVASGGSTVKTATVVIDKGGQVFNVKAYGATGDGSTDDTAAVQTAINQAQVQGGTVLFPPGIYAVSGLTMSGIGVIVEGTGATLRWNGGATPMFYLKSCMLCAITGLTVSVNSSHPLSSFVTQIQGASGYTSTNDSYTDLNILGGGYLARGIWVSMAGGTGGNNNTTLIKNVFIDGYTTAAVEFDGANSFNNSVEDCYFIGNGSTSYGVMLGKGGDSNSGVARIVNSTINANAVDIYADGINTAPVIVDGDFSQGSQQFIAAENMTGSPCPFLVSGVHWATDAYNGSRPEMSFACPGPISINNSWFGSSYAAAPTVIWDYVSGYSAPSFSITSSRFLGSQGYMGDVFTHKLPTHLSDTFYATSDKANWPMRVSYTFASLPPESDGATVYCSDCKNAADDAAGFDSAAAPGGHGTTVLGENGAWRVH